MSQSECQKHLALQEELHNPCSIFWWSASVGGNIVPGAVPRGVSGGHRGDLWAPRGRLADPRHSPDLRRVPLRLPQGQLCRRNGMDETRRDRNTHTDMAAPDTCPSPPPHSVCTHNSPFLKKNPNWYSALYEAFSWGAFVYSFFFPFLSFFFLFAVGAEVKELYLPVSQHNTTAYNYGSSHTTVVTGEKKVVAS